MKVELNNFYNMDCMDGMKYIPDKYFELAIVDPPYGGGLKKVLKMVMVIFLVAVVVVILGSIKLIKHL